MDVQQIYNWLQGLPPMGLYAAFFGVAVLENLIPPIPGDMVTVLGGYWAGRGFLSPLWVHVCSALGNWMGFVLLFALGRWLGKSRLHDLLGARFPQGSLTQAEHWFMRWGYGLILINRFLAGTRAVVSLFAGFTELPWLPVSVLALGSSLAWTGLLVYSGMGIGEEWSRFSQVLETYNVVVLSLMGLALAVWGVFKLWRRR